MSAETQQQFIVFLNSAIDDLANNRLTPEQGLVAVRQFPYLNSQILAQLDNLSILDNEAFKTNLISVLHRIVRDQKVIWAKLPDSEISSSSPLSEKEIVERARHLHEALQTSILVTKNQRVAFARKLAQNWSKQLGLTQEREALFVNKLTEEAQNIPVKASVEDVRDRIGRVLETTTEGARLSKNVIQKDILTEEQKQQANILALTRTIILHDGPDITALAGTIQKKLEEKPPQTTGQFEEALLESDRLVRVAEILTSQVIPSRDAVDLSLGKVLSSFAGNESQAKIGLFVGDTIGLFFDKETQDKIVNAIIAKSETNISSDAAGLERRFGKDAKTAEFQEAMKAMAAGAEGVAAPTGLAGFVTGLLTGSVGQKLIGSPDSFLLTTLELQAKGLLSAETFLGKKKIVPEGLPQNLTAGIWTGAGTITVFYAAFYKEIAHYGYLFYLYLSNKIGFSYDKTGNFTGWILGVGAKKGLEEGTRVAAKTGAGAALTKFLTALGVSTGGPVGGFFAWLGSTVIIGGLGKIFGGIVGFLSNSFTTLGALAKPKSWYDPSTENGLTVFLVITLIAVLLFPMILGSSLPLALVTSSRGSGPTEESPEQFFTPDDFKNFQIATGPRDCPVNNGVIKQRPFEGYSHSGVDAFDIAVTEGSPVVATHDGIVVKIVGNFRKDEYAFRNFGNYVRLVGKNEKGEAFWTTYAHLWGPVPNLVEGQTVKAGLTIIGYVDNTGYSEGTHLHYQYNGPGRLALPKGCAGT